MKAKILSITNDTLMPVSFVVAILGCSYWLGKSVTARIDANETGLQSVQVDQVDFRNLVRLQFDEQRRMLTDIKAQTAATDARMQMLIERRK